MAGKALAGLSILLADDDVLGGFRTRQALVRAGARVAVATAPEAIHYLASPHISAVVVGTLLAGAEARAFLQALERSHTPWVVHGTGGAVAEAARMIPAGDFELLAAALQAVCADSRH